MTLVEATAVLQQTLAALATGTSTAAPVAIGATGNNTDWFAGTIDDLRLYPRALSQSEIQGDMLSPRRVVAGSTP